MITLEIQVKNSMGIHLRPAALFCEEAQKFQSRITLQVHNAHANGKSLLSVLAAGAKKDDKIILTCDGPDENEAMEVLCRLIEDGLGETIEKDRSLENSEGR